MPETPSPQDVAAVAMILAAVSRRPPAGQWRGIPAVLLPGARKDDADWRHRFAVQQDNRARRFYEHRFYGQRRYALGKTAIRSISRVSSGRLSRPPSWFRGRVRG